MFDASLRSLLPSFTSSCPLSPPYCRFQSRQHPLHSLQCSHIHLYCGNQYCTQFSKYVWLVCCKVVTQALNICIPCPNLWSKHIRCLCHHPLCLCCHFEGIPKDLQGPSFHQQIPFTVKNILFLIDLPKCISSHLSIQISWEPMLRGRNSNVSCIKTVTALQRKHWLQCSLDILVYSAFLHTILPLDKSVREILA